MSTSVEATLLGESIGRRHDTPAVFAESGYAVPVAEPASAGSDRVAPAHSPSRGLPVSPFALRASSSCKAFSMLGRAAKSLGRPAARLLLMISVRLATSMPVSPNDIFL